MRLDVYLAKAHSELSRSTLKSLILSGHVTVNNQVVVKPAQEVGYADNVAVDIPEAVDFTEQINDFGKNDVIYMNDNVVVVNKPAGLLTHAKGGLASEFTVADYIRSIFNPQELAADQTNNRLGIVHRLDRATSGVLICARNLSAQHFLQKQFSERKAHKTYWAMVKGVPEHMEAQINLPLARNLKKPATFAVNGKGKSALTNYRVLAIYNDNTSLLELKPLTGRTHQLRVHLSYIGHPIIGDPVYGNGKFGDRLLLHARELEITVPTDNGNNRMTFRAELPTDFARIIEGKCESR